MCPLQPYLADSMKSCISIAGGENDKYCRCHNVPWKWPLPLAIGANSGQWQQLAGDTIWFGEGLHIAVASTASRRGCLHSTWQHLYHLPFCLPLTMLLKLWTIKGYVTGLRHNKVCKSLAASILVNMKSVDPWLLNAMHHAGAGNNPSIDKASHSSLARS